MNTIFRKLILCQVLSTTVVVGILFYLVDDQLKVRIIGDFAAHGETVTRSLARTVESHLVNRDLTSIQSELDASLRIPDVAWAYVVSPEKKILAHTFVPEFPHEYNIADQVWEKSWKEFESKQTGERSIVFRQSVLNGMVGEVFVGFDQSKLRSSLDQIKRDIIAVSLGFIVVAAMGFGVLVRAITKPIGLLTRVLRDFGTDQSKPFVEIPVYSNDELGVLTRAMNEMGREIHHHHGLLDQRVRERTFELQKVMEEAEQSAKALAESEARIRLIVDTAMDAVVNMDSAGYITGWNLQAEKIFGWQAVEVIGKPLSEMIIPERSRVAHSRGLKHYLATGEGPFIGTRVEITALHRTGKEFPVELAVSPIQVKGKIRFSAFIRDITERKNYEANLIKANAEQVKASRLKDEFLASMSHELRTPLNGVLGLSEVLQAQVEGPLNEAQMQSLKQIEECGRHLLQLINDILDLSKIGAGKLQIEIRRVSVSAVCHASLRLVKEIALKRNIKISFDPIPEELFIEADERRLKQMLVNLLGNAVKFTPKNGQIGLQAAMDPKDQTVSLTVWDTGIGISAEDQHRLFQPFVQLDSKLSRQYSGTGLGLTLVKRMAELQGGTVILQSEEGKGSRFTVTLPLRQPHLGNGGTEASSAAAVMALRKRVDGIRSALIIKDSVERVEQLQRYLAEWSIEVESCVRGEDVVATAHKFKPDVIFLDTRLPDVSSWEELKRIRADPLLKSIPFVVASVVQDRESARKAGAFENLGKPLSREAFKRVLQRLGAFAKLNVEEKEEQGSYQGASILLVDDHEVNLKIFRGFLEKKGCHVEVARDGDEAMRKALGCKPELILMDIQMPGIDGLEVTRRLRGEPGFRDTPIIAVTALAMTGDRERCLAAGATDYLSKPVSLKDLDRVIRQRLNSHRERQAKPLNHHV